MADHQHVHPAIDDLAESPMLKLPEVHAGVELQRSLVALMWWHYCLEPSHCCLWNEGVGIPGLMSSSIPSFYATAKASLNTRDCCSSSTYRSMRGLSLCSGMLGVRS